MLLHRQNPYAPLGNRLAGFREAQSRGTGQQSKNPPCSLHIDGAVGVGTGQPRGRTSRHGTGKIFLLSTSSRPILGPTQPPIQWVPGALSPGLSVRGE
jgi:hypothetical protein